MLVVLYHHHHLVTITIDISVTSQGPKSLARPLMAFICLRLLHGSPEIHVHYWNLGYNADPLLI